MLTALQSQQARASSYFSGIVQHLRNFASFAGHETVMRNETAMCLVHPQLPRAPVFVDCTLGGGGHTTALLDLAPGCRVLGIDRDLDAAAHARTQLPVDRCSVQHGSYIDMRAHLSTSGMPPAVHGVIADLGVSSHQLDTPGRGFAYRHDGPLDMRFDASSSDSLLASDLVNSLPEAELRRVFDTYGEDPLAGRLAKAVVERRKGQLFRTTQDLAGVLSEAGATAARKRGWSSPASVGQQCVVRCFQALRIAVNKELQAVQQLMDVAPAVIDPQYGGTIAILTFHSLEDRLVKHAFQALVKGGRGAGGSGLTQAGRGGKQGGGGGIGAHRHAGGKWEYVHPGGLLLPSAVEAERNPRARSAKLRAVRLLPIVGPPGLASQPLTSVAHPVVQRHQGRQVNRQGCVGVPGGGDGM